MKSEPLIMYYPINLDWLNLGLAFGASNACISYEQGVLDYLSSKQEHIKSLLKINEILTKI